MDLADTLFRYGAVRLNDAYFFIPQPRCVPAIEIATGHSGAGLEQGGAQMDMHNFNAQTVLNNLRHKRTLTRPVKYRTSKLDPFRAELVALRHAGASYPEIVAWLADSKHVHTSHTTVMRYLRDEVLR